MVEGFRHELEEALLATVQCGHKQGQGGVEGNEVKCRRLQKRGWRSWDAGAEGLEGLCQEQRGESIAGILKNQPSTRSRRS